MNGSAHARNGQVGGRLVPEPDNELENAQESLESCRANLSAKERELSHHCRALGRDALAKRREGDLAGARFHLQVRSREATRAHAGSRTQN